MRNRILEVFILFATLSLGMIANNQNGYIIRNYTVKPNDTLYKIAKKRNTTVKEILKYNNIEDANLITPGMKIKIVLKDNEQGFNKYKKKEITSVIIDRNFYRVEENDSLSRISKRFEVSIEKLLRLNDIKNPDLIYRGQVIRIREDNVKKYKSRN